jgi:hypothetical protein
VKLLLDNNLSPKLARALHALSQPEHEVHHLRDLFDPKTPDEEWLQQLGAEGGWVIVSGDLRISRNKDELNAWFESGMTAFFLDRGWAHLGFWEKTARLVQWWPRILEVLESVGSQVGYFVPVRGSKLKILRTK